LTFGDFVQLSASILPNINRHLELYYPALTTWTWLHFECRGAHPPTRESEHRR